MTPRTPLRRRPPGLDSRRTGRLLLQFSRAEPHRWADTRPLEIARLTGGGAA
jgi:hypothetical protein